MLYKQDSYCVSEAPYHPSGWNVVFDETKMFTWYLQHAFIFCREPVDLVFRDTAPFILNIHAIADVDVDATAA